MIINELTSVWWLKTGTKNLLQYVIMSSFIQMPIMVKAHRTDLISELHIPKLAMAQKVVTTTLPYLMSKHQSHS